MHFLSVPELHLVLPPERGVDTVVTDIACSTLSLPDVCFDVSSSLHPPPPYPLHRDPLHPVHHSMLLPANFRSHMDVTGGFLSNDGPRFVDVCKF